jgi:hypothetical protein
MNKFIILLVQEFPLEFFINFPRFFFFVNLLRITTAAGIFVVGDHEICVKSAKSQISTSIE